MTYADVSDAGHRMDCSRGRWPRLAGPDVNDVGYRVSPLASASLARRQRRRLQDETVTEAAGLGRMYILESPVGHLKRLEQIRIDPAVFFVTTCTRNRRTILADERVAKILVDEWKTAQTRHQWDVGRYVVMPDHVHFFCSPGIDAKSLSDSVGLWKQWTSKRILAETHRSGPLWQREFFDHLIRSNESYHQKWEYIKENPVRAGLVKQSREWPWQGEVSDLSPKLWQ